MPKRIYVGNLPSGATQREVRDLFSRHGAVDSVQLETDRATGRLVAFIEMPDDRQADAAMAALNQTMMGGRALNVNEARPRQE
jgi:cold-inducible RNA-binding protein